MIPAIFEHVLIYLGILFLFLGQAITSLVILYLLLQVKPLALELEYIAGTSDMLMEAQREHTKLIVALLENN
jgi:hypothetical protein